MSRRPEVRYWDSRGGYYCTHLGVQHKLSIGPKDEPDGPCFKDALAKFNEVVYGIKVGPTIKDLIGKYNEYAKHNLQEVTARIHRETLAVLAKGLGDRQVYTFTVYDLQRYCDGMRDERGWTDGGVRLKIASLKCCLSWAANMGLILSNPIAKMKLPPSGTRGLEVCLNPEEEIAAVRAARGPALDVVQTLRDTGARPGELAKLEAKDYSPELRAFVLEARNRDPRKRHKTARTGRARVIYLGKVSQAIVERLMQEHPTGPLFRTPNVKRRGLLKGQRVGWKTSNFRDAFKKLRRGTGIKQLIPYSFRHTFAVRWLRARKPIEALAEVLGTSVLMIQRHYGHLADQRDYLRRLVDELDDERLGG